MWLASYPKSGNTWMRAFLHNVLRQSTEPADINQMTGSLTQGESSIGWYRIVHPRPASQWTPAEVARMRPRVHEMIAGGQKGTVFCKTHNILNRVHGQPTINTKVSAGAIYIVRNPLDVLSSFADFQGVGIDEAITIMATQDFATMQTDGNVCETLGSWSQHVSSWTKQSSQGFHVVRYEDLIDDPVKAFGEVLAFMKLEVAHKRLERAVRNASFKELRKQEDERGFNERPDHQQRFFRKGRAGQWKHELSAAQVARMCDEHGEMMEKFGYLPDRQAPLLQEKE
ncbi:MAG: sulfotransferase domain-containing protein [Alphaproteobacteria bacterium]|nr:sulfotransferase domain-containing protein [Rhodospirillaceae bacterium]MBT7614431.1 sulfotransferase domain-containing protein [Rhodospirillaceae bacterium]MDG2479954.1 sulfotransferase domain-containing protein [Alphaproteobacteria bacterium]